MDFVGASGEHTFESWIYFSLEDVTDPVVPVEVDNRTWTFDYEEPYGTPILPCTLSYTLVPGNDYTMTIGSHAMAGDGGVGFARLEATVVPEPATLALLGLGALLLRKRK